MRHGSSETTEFHRMRQRARTGPDCRGVSLVELMVTVAIGMFLVLGTVTVFLKTSDDQRVNESLSRLQENARFVLDILEHDIRMAGFWGLSNDASLVERRRGQPNQLADIDDCGDRWYIDISNPIQSSNNANPFGAASADPCIPDDDYRDGTDVLVLRHAAGEPEAPQAGVAQIQSDVGRSRLFSDGAVPAGFQPTSQTHRLVAHAYFVNDAGEPPALHRIELGDGPAVVENPILPGVEDLQVQFGVDTDGDNAADRFVNPGNEPAGAVIVAARIWVLMRSTSFEAGFADDALYEYADRRFIPVDDEPDAATFRRLLVSRTIQLRNVPVGMAL